MNRSKISTLTLVLAMPFAAVLFAHDGEGEPPREAVGMASGSIHFSRVVSLSHPVREDAPLFPGDPPVEIEVVNTIEEDGYLLESVRQGTHTGTHVSAPGHFLADGLTIDALPANMFVHPAVVVDVRRRTAANPDFQVGWPKIRSLEIEHGQRIPEGACVILFTGFQDRFFSPVGPETHDDYFDVAPGFSPELVERLARPVSEGGRGVTCLGSDTFGPDATSDEAFAASTAIYEAGGVTIENMAGLEQLHTFGDVIVLAPPRLQDGSGFQTDVLGFVNPAGSPDAADKIRP